MEHIYGNNQMHLLKKMDYKGFMASLCGVLLAILISFFIVNICDGRIARMTLFEVKNYQYIPNDILLTIEIPKEGGVWLDGRILDDNSLSKLEGLIEDKFEENAQREVRIRLKADQGVPYGKIVQVLQVLPRVGIKSVFLVTEGDGRPVIDFATRKKIPN
ncbi:MAG: Biopolymer transport protein ExbD/TolR [Acidobacteriota bacterium]|nr:Biopolymer transport protein ExbD/TolR [Acidobacteriota bacterium]